MPDVRVQVSQTGASATTDAGGAYSISGLTPGSYTLVFTFDDLEPARRQVTVAAGSQASLDVTFDESLRAMESITVLGQRTSMALARSAQKEAENIVTVLPLEELRKLPVVNSADAVRIIPGIQVETDTGEGRFVNIRGLDSDLQSTTFGGVRLPPTDVTTSPYGGSRAVSFDAIPSEMIGAIAVTKTNRPEQEAEAIGGTIEITPKTVPLDGKPYFGDLRLGSGYEPLRRTSIKDFALTAGGRFGGDGDYRPFSALAVISYYEDRRGVDDLEGAYTDQQPLIPDKAQLVIDERYYRQHKKRHVYGAEVGYAPNTANKWYLRYYDFGVVQDYNRNEFQFNLSGNPAVLPDGSFSEPAVQLQKDYRSTTETFDTRVAALGGSNDLDRVKLDYFIAHTQGLYNKPFDYLPVWINSATSSLVYNNGNSDHPFITVTGGANPYDTAGYTLTQFSTSSQRSITKDWSSKLNVAIPTHWTGYETEQLKFGIGARKRTFDQAVGTYVATSVPPIPLSAATFGSNIVYYDGRYSFGPLIGTDVIQAAFANGNGAGFTHDPVADAAASAHATYSVKEDVYAAYGQYQFGFDKLGIFGGLRIEGTKASFDAFAVDNSNNIAPISTNHSYTDFLPSLQTRYEFTPSIIGRAIYSSTIGRPGYNQESPSLVVNFPANLVSQGNPNIKPIHSHNFDLSFEDYLPRGGIFSVGVFYKDLKDYIVSELTQTTFPNTGLFAGFTGPIKVQTFTNGAPAKLIGLEFDFHRQFVELPGWWSGFGTDVNGTSISSRIEIRPGSFTQLPSTARRTGNLTLFYEREQVVSVRIGANYISRSLFAIGGNASTDIYSESRLSVDFGSSYFISHNFSVYLNVKNLTNAPLKYSEGYPLRPIQRETYRETIQFGVNANF